MKNEKKLQTWFGFLFYINIGIFEAFFLGQKVELKLFFVKSNASIFMFYPKHIYSTKKYVGTVVGTNSQLMRR